MINKKRFAKRFKRGFFNQELIVKSLKLLDKLDKHLKFNRSKKTMEILQDKSKLRETILLVKDVITTDPNTMKSNDTAS